MFHRQLQIALVFTRNADSIPTSDEIEIEKSFENACVNYGKLAIIEHTKKGMLKKNIIHYDLLLVLKNII